MKSDNDTLFITDLDGTLLNDKSLISSRSIELINKAIAAGVNFSVATARTPATLHTILGGLDLTMPIVCMTGSAIWDPATGQYLDTRFHKESDVRQLLGIYRKYNLPTFIYTMRDNKLHIYHSGALSDFERKFIEERRNNPYKEFHIPENGESELPDNLDNVILLFAIQPIEEARKAYSEIGDTDKINSVFYPDLFNPEIAFIEAFPKDATKAEAIKRLCRMTGMKRIVAFGDNVNDIPMFEIADQRIAVANAVEKLKLQADKIIGLNTDDAVAIEISNRIPQPASGYPAIGTDFLSDNEKGEPPLV